MNQEPELGAGVETGACAGGANHMPKRSAGKSNVTDLVFFFRKMIICAFSEHYH
ncbi:hypothetical protein [Mesorhizobium sp.]|uniref:hypothetical protein n=1 Tax=Mesorhizobium sp. TaxID=1871066 RepID=UPI0025FA24C5|nr:hypothetical protein [Mesorhizobium sp.]